MIKPTIGRRVWYWPHLTEAAYWDRDSEGCEIPSQPFDAGIAHVNLDGTINISVFNDLGNAMPGKQNVHQTTPEERKVGCWSWMPYQVGVASQAGQVMVGTTGGSGNSR